MAEFKEFPKIFRYSRDVVITEKLDGTNACVVIEDDNGLVGRISAQSRTRIITPEDDNYGFAKWVQTNADVLKATLGVGYHYGEWWGQGIQRGYGMNRKVFSLFNTHRWASLDNNDIGLSVVPTLWKGNMNEIYFRLEMELGRLEELGSAAAPGFMKPEGVVIFHTHGNFLLKKTFDKDDAGKGHGA